MEAEKSVTVKSELVGVTITKDGIVFAPGLPESTWRETLSMLKAVHDGYHAALADTISYGRSNYGEETVAEAMTQLEFPQADFNRACDVAKVPIGLRKNQQGLNSEHYQVVGHVFGDDEIKQKTWLKAASEEKLSPGELKRSIDAGKVVKDAAKTTGRGSGGLVTIQGIMFGFSKWKEQVTEEQILNGWGEVEKREFLRETRDFANLRRAVVESLM